MLEVYKKKLEQVKRIGANWSKMYIESEVLKWRQDRLNGVVARIESKLRELKND